MESRWKSHVRRWCTSWKSQKNGEAGTFLQMFIISITISDQQQMSFSAQPHPLTPSDPSRMANLELYPSVTLYQVSDTQKNIISSITAKIQMTLISLYDPKMLCLSWDHMPIVPMNGMCGVCPLYKSIEACQITMFIGLTISKYHIVRYSIPIMYVLITSYTKLICIIHVLF